MTICNAKGNECDEVTMNLLKEASMKTKPFNLEGKKLVCRALSVHDSDTLWCAACPYAGDCHRINLRLTGFDAPEMATKNLEEKKLSITARKHFLRLLAPEVFAEDKGWETDKEIKAALSESVVLFYAVLEGQDKYGRVLSTIFKTIGDNVSINQRMIESGLVDVYGGGKKVRSWEVVTPDAPKE